MTEKDVAFGEICPLELRDECQGRVSTPVKSIGRQTANVMSVRGTSARFTCRACGVDFEARKAGRIGIRYCSPTCRPLCAALECERPATASQGFCWAHYQRLRAYGDPNAPRLPSGGKPQPPKYCTVVGCNKIHDARGLCNGHAAAWRRANNPERCGIDGCDTPVHAKALCLLHYQRVAKFGDPNGTAISTACPAGHEFTPENTSYAIDRRDGSKSRSCRTCHRSSQARRRAIKRDADADLILTSDVMERDGWRCGICREPIPPDAQWPDPLFASIDHRIPLARGGRHVLANVQAAHIRCNWSKGAREQVA